jgi:hypothetical protein
VSSDVTKADELIKAIAAANPHQPIRRKLDDE